MSFVSLRRLSLFYNKMKGLIDGKVSRLGDTMTGNLIVGSAKVQTNGYVIGTWLQATASNALSSTPPRICVQDASGWIYSRTPAQIREDIGASAVTVREYTATINTTWTGSADPFTKNVAISGITSDDKPIIDIVTTTAAHESQETEWAKIYKAETYNGGIKFYAKEKTTVSLTIIVKVVG